MAFSPSKIVARGRWQNCQGKEVTDMSNRFKQQLGAGLWKRPLRDGEILLRVCMAGLMLTPLALCLPQGQGRWSGALFSGYFGEALGILSSSLTSPLLATLVHAAGMLTAMALMAWLVYEKFGVAILRHWWLNFDLLWGVALFIAGITTLTLPTT